MKGFIRILEAIISSLLLIAVLPFFLSGPAESGWGSAILQTQALDALSALQKNRTLEIYVRNNDVQGLNRELARLIPKTTDFSIEINGIPNPVILVGCICTSAQLQSLEDLLWPLEFSYKRRQISIRISNMTMNTIDPRTRVLFIFGYVNLIQYRTTLTRFLENGGTVFMFTDLTKPQTEDGVMNVTFGLRWNEALSAGGAAGFYTPQDVTRISHKISGFYSNISGGQESDTFGGFSTGNVNKIEIDNKTVVFSGGVSLVKANDFISKNGKGRTVWFANYDYTLDTENAKRLKNLTKATFLWASGENYRMDPFTKIPGEVFFHVTYTDVLEGFEPFEIRLLLWKLFF